MTSDSHRCTCTLVGLDKKGNFVLEISILENIGPVYFTNDTIYIITRSELELYAEQSLNNKHITYEEYQDILKRAKEIEMKND